jgi:thiamine-monophosphate kinase
VPSEFALIERCFARRARQKSEPGQTTLGIGDDAALLKPAPGHELVVSTDLLVEGTHFFPDVDPADLGWKTLAVNVSDMAAMGATPRWATLGIAVPVSSPDWMDAFASGFFECAERYGVELVGGDTTRGPRCLAVTIFGELPAGTALRRDGARAGDSLWVSGCPGRAAQGLACLEGRLTLDEPARGECLAALHRPQPRLALGLGLRGLASAAIDVSDGLLADLGHILERSGVAAEVCYAVPPAPTFSRETWLAGGDDYELLFTCAPQHDAAVAALGARLGLPLQRIGQILAEPAGSLRVVDAAGADITPARRGFDHFG